MARQDNLINIASKIAQLSQHKFQIGAVLVKGKRIISFGVNKYKSHPKQINPHTKEQGSSIHAELDCLIKAPYQMISGSSIYVARLLRGNGVHGYCRPCSSCISILKEYQVSKIIYTLEGTGYLEEEIE